MRVVTLEVPHLGNRSHLVHDGTVAVVVDPPRDVRLVEAAAAGVQIVAVAETHLHEDYASGGLVLAHRHGADYLGEPLGAPRRPVRGVRRVGDALGA